MSKRPVTDPMLRSIINSQLSRRKLLLGAGGLSVAGMLAACGTGGGTGGSSSKPSPAADVSDSDKTVSWANWTLYLDYDDSTQKYPSLEAFSAATGIKANYSEDVDGNDTYFGKVQGQLAAGQDIGQDIVTLTDWMAARLIRLGYTQELDLANIPNSKNLLPTLQDVDFDPGRRHSLTWQSGFAGIAWNKEAFPQGLKSVSDLWNPELKGRVEVLDEMRDTMGLLMMDNGVDITGDWGDQEFDNALDVLSKQISDGQIRQVKGNSYKEDLISGDALAVIGWSGDITQLNFEEGDKWEFAIPEAGGTLWSDNLLVPIGATHKANAEKLMDYYFDPVNAATVAAYVNFICPVEGAREAMQDINPELVENPLIFPTDDFLANTHVLRTLTPDEETDYSGRFQTAIGN
ncbi:spermidine/putrescine ABC transporter substrate-binding protein [Arthrobacter sp. Sa2CUA1]|uniref:Spermidine/putrescine ABC transporter substrate-binding protein n=1 Tax=Arthrobacter gallicola TaxID=2762225 RepID=A0ABR8UW89_9MICC|nr:spermidine/putrescine ABC transporter substrate-binding protein [Arthrobacter gallicola]MBD7996794.1 spermidine/putrescine ABC transporter substrate-binding protein [Arthrobacter gallicola]